MRWIGFGIACFAAILGFFLCRPKPLATPELSFWFWQTPYTLSLQDRADLKRIGVSQMFVRAGTFTTDGKSVVLRFPQKYGPGADALPVHLVFNFDGGVVRHFEKFELDAMAEDVARRIKIQWDSALAAGLKVEGYQLDFDSPTRLLPRYADLVKRIRGKLPKTTVSATGLMSWLGTPQLRVLSRELAFLIPQAYEGETGLSVDRMRPISDPDYLRRALPEAESLACPYYVGLPTYEHESFAHSLAICREIIEKYPRSKVMPRALYTAAISAGHLAGMNEWWRSQPYDLNTKAAKYLTRLHATFPNHPLAASAKKYAKVFDPAVVTWKP